MFFSALALIAALAVACFFVGRSRSLATVGGVGRLLHSRPSYHGSWLALATAGPTFLVLCAWSVIVPRLEREMLLSRFGTDVANFSQAQLDGFWRDIRAIAEGGTPGIRDQMREAAAAAYQSINVTTDVLIAVVLLAMAIAGLWFGSRAIAPGFRARHRVETVVRVLLVASAAIAVLTTVGIVLSLIAESFRFFRTVPVTDFLFGLTWTPQQMAFRTDQVGGTAAFGFVPLITGTLLITGIAMLVAAPIGLLSAVYLSDYASKPVRAIGKPALEVLAGIPTVVYGFFAAITVAPLIRDGGRALGLDVASESALAAGIVMGIMIVPFVSSLSDDIINAVPQSLRDGSLAMGATKSETIVKVVLPAALPGIVSALILATSRAIGETMIVVMAAGMAANLTLNPLEAVTTVTVQISALLTGDQEFDTPKTLSAFGLGLALFVITLTLNMVALRVVKKYREQYE